MALAREAILAYTAGVIDADGCMGLNLTAKGTYRININVSDASGRVTAWLKKEWGGTLGTYIASSCNRALISRWFISNNRVAVAFAETILPYLVLKREQAELIVKFPLLKQGQKADPHITEVREALRVQIRMLNARYSSKKWAGL